MKEIERKFLVRETGGTPPPDRVRIIHSAYLAAGDPEVRISCNTIEPVDGYKLTVKAGKGLTREEIEVPVSAFEGITLFNMVGGPQIRKVRSHFGPWEYDVFLGNHTGLLLLEIELETETSLIPELPSGLQIVRDVTFVEGYKNKNLALHGLPE